MQTIGRKDLMGLTEEGPPRCLMSPDPCSLSYGSVGMMSLSYGPVAFI